jgi:hypothetical protein
MPCLLIGTGPPSELPVSAACFRSCAATVQLQQFADPRHRGRTPVAKLGVYADWVPETTRHRPPAPSSLNTMTTRHRAFPVILGAEIGTKARRDQKFESGFLQRRVRCEPFSPAGEPNGIQSLSAATRACADCGHPVFRSSDDISCPGRLAFPIQIRTGRLLDARALVSDRRASGRASWDPVFGCLQHLSLEPVAMIAQSGNSRAVT